MTVTWGQVTAGAIIRYQHMNKKRRLAGLPPNVRTGRVMRVHPPVAGSRVGQIVAVALNRDGTPNRSLGQFTVPIDFIVSVTAPAAGAQEGARP